jgi:hypothetical protein
MKPSKTREPSVETSESIVNQGTVPYKKTEDVAMPSAPIKGFTSKGQRAGEQEARGFGLQMRPTKFVVR